MVLAVEVFVPPGRFLGPQPNTLQHSLCPGREAIRRDVEETGGVGGGGEEAKSSHPSSLPPVYLSSPTTLNTYYVPGTGTVLGTSLYVSFNHHSTL